MVCSRYVKEYPKDVWPTVILFVIPDLVMACFLILRISLRLLLLLKGTGS